MFNRFLTEKTGLRLVAVLVMAIAVVIGIEQEGSERPMAKANSPDRQQSLSSTSLIDAVTVTWNRQALGQTQTYPCSPGTFNWPNNNNWSQQEVIAIDNVCNPPQPYVAQPSNWSGSSDYP